MVILKSNCAQYDQYRLCEGDNRAAPCCHEAEIGKYAMGLVRKKKKEKKREKNELTKKEGKKIKKEKRTKQEQKISTRTNITNKKLV